MQVVANGANHYQAGLQPDAHLETLAALLAREVTPVGVNGGQDVERGQDGAHGVILVRHRRAEEGQDTIAEQLRDRAS
jgi:hypothetical protein